MTRAIPKELEMEIRSQLRVLVFGGPGSMIYTNLATPHLELDAINYLRDIGALEDLGTGTYPVTAYGREHWGKLTAPRWYWFRRNWFPASVAGATILVSLVAAIANIVNLVL